MVDWPTHTKEKRNPALTKDRRDVVKISTSSIFKDGGKREFIKLKPMQAVRRGSWRASMSPVFTAQSPSETVYLGHRCPQMPTLSQAAQQQHTPLQPQRCSVTGTPWETNAVRGTEEALEPQKTPQIKQGWDQNGKSRTSKHGYREHFTKLMKCWRNRTKGGNRK